MQATIIPLCDLLQISVSANAESHFASLLTGISLVGSSAEKAVCNELEWPSGKPITNG